MSLRSRYAALRHLRGPRDVLTLLRLTPLAALVPLLVRLPLPRLGRIVAPAPARRTPDPERVERLDRVMGLAPRLTGPLVRPGCLTRGITLLWFLRRAGLDVELVFGIDPHEVAGDGHCWLALDGEPFLERQALERFVETYRLPLRAA